MGSADQVSSGRSGNKGLAELNYHKQNEHKEVRDSIMGEGQRLSEEDESRINEVVNGGREGEAAPLAHQAGLQQQQQQQLPLGPVVRWERFLPRRSLKVLLVENDDSTRQLVSALLRNCSYEVTAVANGLQAWKILEDLTNHVDLVLTEVVMPCLSGIGLLGKIMNHKTCKNIPVIMMSSHDSMGVVFKCLSKGAVDFLVKPIRKNELRNLWQHVWRRCYSSSGSVSGSESGIQTQKPAKSKNDDDSDNNTGSDDEDENGSIGLTVMGGSDNGSETQSSWTKRAVEVDSPQRTYPSEPLVNSSCAQVIYPKPEDPCNQWLPKTTTRECQEQKELAENDSMGKDLEIGVPRNPDVQLESHPSEKISTSLGMDKLPEGEPKKDTNEGLLEHESSNAFGKPSTQAADLIGRIPNSIDAQKAKTLSDTPNGFSNISESYSMVIGDTKEMPSLELSLKRLKSTGAGGIATHDDRNVLRRSSMSAFSRYNSVAASTQAPTRCGGSSSPPLDNDIETVKTESMCNIINPNAAPMKQGFNGSSDNNEMGSTTKNVFTKPAAFKDKQASKSTVNFMHPSAFQHVQHQTSATPEVMQENDELEADAMVEQPRGAHREVEVQHHHHHYHHHHHRVHSMKQQQQLQLPPDHDHLSLKNMAAPSAQCGSSNVFGGSMEGNAANYSLNGSISGSDHGSNGQNGSSTAVDAGGMNMESDNGVVDVVGAGDGHGSGSGSGSGVNQNRFAHREAALTKFRQKRKERCFAKKVRYQSRKKLAEQRPRVRGQFVRQMVYEHTSREADS